MRGKATTYAPGALVRDMPIARKYDSLLARLHCIYGEDLSVSSLLNISDEKFAARRGIGKLYVTRFKELKNLLSEQVCAEPTSELRAGALDGIVSNIPTEYKALFHRIMHVNNETGIIQPIDEIAAGLPEQGCYFHVDAAQGYGKEQDKLNQPRIDLISISGHKIYGPKGVGALIMRRRKFKRAPLSPIQFGGGQERGLRPGTLPVPLVAGLGVAAILCKKNHNRREVENMTFRNKLLAALNGLDYEINGDEMMCVPHALNLSFNGLNSEAVMLVLKGIVAISNGSACTSQSYKPSHVLTAMGLPEGRIQSALRFSWCHLTDEPNWNKLREGVSFLM